MMRDMRSKIVACLFAVVFSLAVLTACGNGNGNGGSNGGVTTIRVDLHGWTPTVSSTSTAGSKAYNSPKAIAKAFEELHDNKVKIEWVRDKQLVMDTDSMAQYFSLATESRTCPSIAFTWGTTYQDRGWYVDLTPYLEETNSYETATDLAGKKWKESFRDYIWSLSGISTYSGKIVAVPVTLFAGSASAVYYNTSKLAQMGYITNSNPTTPGQYEFGIDEPVNWTTWMEIVDTAMADNVKYINDTTSYPYSARSWLMQFELGPAYLSHAMQYIDTNRNNVIDGAELLQGVKSGYLNPVTQPYARELLQECKNYLSRINENNLDSREWIAGSGVASYKGTVSYTPEKDNNLPFNWEMVPTPVKDDSEFTRDYVDWVSFDEAQPNVDLYLNIMRAGVTKDGTVDGEIDENKLYYSVEFLKYLTTREANSAMVEEMNTSIGAVIGADKPFWLTDSAFALCKFAKTPCVDGWPSGFTAEQMRNMDTLFTSWVNGNRSDDSFFEEWNRMQVKGAEDMAASLGITLQ